MDGLTEGRMVHWVIDHGRNKGEHRPAVVVKIWDKTHGAVNLQVFTDGTNDFPANQPGSNGLYWATSVNHSEDKAPGTWHWIEKA